MSEGGGGPLFDKLLDVGEPDGVFKAFFLIGEFVDGGGEGGIDSNVVEVGVEGGLEGGIEFVEFGAIVDVVGVVLVCVVRDGVDLDGIGSFTPAKMTGYSVKRDVLEDEGLITVLDGEVEFIAMGSGFVTVVVVVVVVVDEVAAIKVGDGVLAKEFDGKFGRSIFLLHLDLVPHRRDQRVDHRSAVAGLLGRELRCQNLLQITRRRRQRTSQRTSQRRTRESQHHGVLTATSFCFASLVSTPGVGDALERSRPSSKNITSK